MLNSNAAAQLVQTKIEKRIRPAASERSPVSLARIRMQSPQSAASGQKMPILPCASPLKVQNTVEPMEPMETMEHQAAGGAEKFSHESEETDDDDKAKGKAKAKVKAKAPGKATVEVQAKGKAMAKAQPKTKANAKAKCKTEAKAKAKAKASNDMGVVAEEDVDTEDADEDKKSGASMEQEEAEDDESKNEDEDIRNDKQTVKLKCKGTFAGRRPQETQWPRRPSNSSACYLSKPSRKFMPSFQAKSFA